MKKTISLIASLLISIFVFAQTKPANITGTVDKNDIVRVSLFKVLNGRLVEVALSIPDSEGRFGFRFTPEYEGFYVIGSGTSTRPQGNFKFYFRGNEDLVIKLHRDDYELISTNSKEIKALNQWDVAVAEIQAKANRLGGQSTYVDFFPQVEEMSAKLAQYKKDPKTGNKNFDKLFPSYVDYDFAYYAISYNYLPRSAHPDQDEFTPYYQNFNVDNYLNDFLLQLPYGDRFFSNLILQKNKGKNLADESLLIASIPSDVLKGQFIVSKMERARSMEEFLISKEAYKQYITLPEQIARVAAVESKLAESKTGATAVSFSYPDVTGKQTALKDLRGKVVLIDMWATWCGPCRAEEPHWEKLNEEFAGKDVAFVGVSVDKEKDKWETYVKEKKLKGIQLHAGPGNILSQSYKVDGIPRYILVDKKGNLIAADSPRPSDPKLKEMISKALAN